MSEMWDAEPVVIREIGVAEFALAVFIGMKKEAKNPTASVSAREDLSELLFKRCLPRANRVLCLGFKMFLIRNVRTRVSNRGPWGIPRIW